MDGLHRDKADALNRGCHAIAFYAKDEDYLDGVLFFAEQGIRRREKIFFVTDAYPSEAILDYFRGLAQFDVQKALDGGQLNFLCFGEVYLYKGKFDARRIFELIYAASARSLKEGYSGIRVVSEMSHTLCEVIGPEGLVEYEARANLHIPKCACTAVCQYDRRRFKPGLLLDLFPLHPYVASGRRIYDNHHFLAPGECLRRNVHEVILDRMIGDLQSGTIPARQKDREQDFHCELLRCMPAFYAVIDEEGKTVFVNQAMLNKLGYTLEEVRGKDYTKTFVPQEERASVAEELRHLYASEQPRKSRGRVLSKDGREFVMEWHGKRELAENGSPGDLFLIGLDVSESRGMHEAAWERVGSFDLAPSDAEDAVVVLNGEGKVCYWNLAAERLLGRGREEMGEVKYTDFLHPDDAGKVAGLLSLVWRGEIRGPFRLKI